MTKSIIAIFNSVRDMPYRLRLAVDEEDFSCDGKHQKLKALLEDTGQKVRWRMCLYTWADLPVPEHVLALRPYDLYYHSYLELAKGYEWIILDATWDSGLSDILPVNTWDGKLNTSIAVPCVEKLSIKETREVLQKTSKKENVQRSLNKNKEFYVELNKWLNSARR